MTKLNDYQEELLAAVGAAKQAAEDAEADLQEQFKRQLWEAQRPLRMAVGEAADAGVPWRRLQEPLETSDHKTVKGFYPTSGDRMIVRDRQKKKGGTK